jgi:hypothetical protein
MSVNLSDYDFLDFGCSGGGSMKFAQTRLGGTRGLGFDISPEKVAAAREQGFEAEVADLSLPLDFPGKSRFVILSHFLEHLPSPLVAGKVIRTACNACREFLFIRYPWFDSDGPLSTLGVKLYWSDWKGHPNRMSSFELYLILLRLHQKKILSDFRIFGYGSVTTTSADCLIPIQAPPDQHHYDESKHGPKPVVPLTFPCFKEVMAVVWIGPAASLDPLAPLADKTLLLDKAGAVPAIAAAGGQQKPETRIMRMIRQIRF